MIGKIKADMKGKAIGECERGFALQFTMVL